MTAVDLCGLVHDVAARMSLEAKSCGAEIQVGPCETLVAYADPVRMEQVMINLISNALKYGKGRPVEVRLSSDGAPDAERRAILSVKDQGIGISKEDLTRVFERFERATQHEAGQSLGLGLFITREIIEAHHGTIRVESELGQGSMFEVALPLSQVE
jgi:signal transduction histidine kinase